MLATQTPVHGPAMSVDDLGRILASFEVDLFRINNSLSKESKATRSTVRDLSAECERAKQSVADLNTELSVVVKRQIRK